LGLTQTNSDRTHTVWIGPWHWALRARLGFGRSELPSGIAGSLRLGSVQIAIGHCGLVQLRMTLRGATVTGICSHTPSVHMLPVHMFVVISSLSSPSAMYCVCFAIRIIICVRKTSPRRPNTSPRQSKIFPICPKTSSLFLPMFFSTAKFRNNINKHEFQYLFLPQVPPRPHNTFKSQLRLSPNLSNTLRDPPRRPTTTPRPSNTSSRLPQDAQRPPQDLPKHAPIRPKTFPIRPKTFPRNPKNSLRRLKTLSGRLKDCQDASSPPQTAPMTPQPQLSIHQGVETSGLRLASAGSRNEKNLQVRMLIKM
jgi:hypothetical protein